MARGSRLLLLCSTAVLVQNTSLRYIIHLSKLCTYLELCLLQLPLQSCLCISACVSTGKRRHPWQLQQLQHVLLYGVNIFARQPMYSEAPVQPICLLHGVVCAGCCCCWLPCSTPLVQSMHIPRRQPACCFCEVVPLQDIFAHIV